MRIAIVTDAWAPQVNGVVRTLTSVTAVVIAGASIFGGSGSALAVAAAVYGGWIALTLGAP